MKALIVTADELQRGDWLVGWVVATSVGEEPMAFRRMGRVANPKLVAGPSGRRYIVCRPDNEDEEAVA